VFWFVLLKILSSKSKQGFLRVYRDFRCVSEQRRDFYIKELKNKEQSFTKEGKKQNVYRWSVSLWMSVYQSVTQYLSKCTTTELTILIPTLSIPQKEWHPIFIFMSAAQLIGYLYSWVLPSSPNTLHDCRPPNWIGRHNLFLAWNKIQLIYFLLETRSSSCGWCLYIYITTIWCER
jgi:hypothetical protein